jgi:Zn-dependent protease/CBS domain-containing protein
MESQFNLGRLFGIRLGLSLSWVIIALLIGLSLGTYFAQVYPAWESGVIVAMAVVTALFFFVAIALHELAHALVARARGLRVRSVTLFALGGLTQVEEDAGDPTTEFLMGIAGPLASLAIGAICLAAASLGGWRRTELPGTPLLASLVWLGYINLALAAFNMLPGFPLDGGRVVRAIVWGVTGNADRATRIAARSGQTVALLLIALGVLQVLGGAGIGGLWMAFIGWFLLEAAGASLRQIELRRELHGVRVGDVMSRDFPSVSKELSLQRFVDEHLLRSGERCMVVKDGARIVGLITSHEVASVPRDRWPNLQVDEVMRPLGNLHTVALETPVVEALEAMQREDVNQLPVVEDGAIQGILSRTHVLGLLATHAELHL